MVVRKRTRFERLFSFNQHRKRFGAKQYSRELLQVSDFSGKKNSLVEGEDVQYTHGSEKEVGMHLANLRLEFAGQSELLYYHAQLIVMIRREYQVDEHFSKFQELWESEADYLVKELNTRWLVSAADTFADHDEDPVVKALSLNASILANTVKLQETERFLQKGEGLADDSERQQRLIAGRLALFDGTSAFAVGTDDTLRNMRWRINEISKIHYVGVILMEIFQRLQENENVYRRFRMRHTRNRTAWW